MKNLHPAEHVIKFTKCARRLIYTQNYGNIAIVKSNGKNSTDMKKALKILAVAASLPIIGLSVLAFTAQDPRPDYIMPDLSGFDPVPLPSLQTGNEQQGMFKSTVSFLRNAGAEPQKEFYGQEIRISGNDKLDKILIGITNNLNSRIEAWNGNHLVEAKELGFMKKMTWGSGQELSVEFYSQDNAKYPGKSRISLRFYEGPGFFGDIGNIQMDLTPYGNLSGAKSIGLFAKPLDGTALQTEPAWKNLRVWKHYNSFD